MLVGDFLAPGESRRQATCFGAPVSLFHFHASEGREIVVSIEVRATGRVSERDFIGLKVLIVVAGDTFLLGVRFRTICSHGRSACSIAQKYLIDYQIKILSAFEYLDNATIIA